MTTFIIIGVCTNFFLAGFLTGLIVFKHKFFLPQRKLLKQAQKGWADAIQIAVDIAATKELTPLVEEKPTKGRKKKGEKMILSPLQVKRFGQPD